MKCLIILLITTLTLQLVPAQTIKGQLKAHTGQNITLTGFNYYNSYELAATTIDSLGNFEINYGTTYKGMGILKTQDNSSLVLVLTEANIILQGTHLQETDGLYFVASKENIYFLKYGKTKGEREAALVGLKYLMPLYKEQQELQVQTSVTSTIQQEIERLEQKDIAIVKQLDKKMYIKWFIPIKNLVNDMPKTIYKYPERIPQNIQQFREIDFNHPNFKTSGLFKELIEGHFMLLENMGQNLESVYAQMNNSTDYLITSLKENDSLLNTVSEALLKYFEKRSLYPAAAHLSNQMLTQNQCVLNTSLANSMQKYRVLKVGNIAPDIQLDANTTLSSIKKPVLLVFGASWCPYCKDEALELLKYYHSWKEKVQLEVVYLSIDTDEQAYKTAYQNAPWQIYCDYKGWDTQAAKDYFINATPSYFLLDKNREILVHPKSIEHVNTWVNYKL